MLMRYNLESMNSLIHTGTQNSKTLEKHKHLKTIGNAESSDEWIGKYSF
jgi:hypothetical protein